MRFRPCIDIHNGEVKQIVGGSLKDKNDTAKENFISRYDASYYAAMYKRDNLPGGHVILLNKRDSPYYKKDLEQALLAFKEYPQGLQAGGGITDQNARWFLDNGASHVIVTSFVFRDGCIDYDNLKKLCHITGKEKLVLDLSCRKKDGKYYVMTDRWQKYTKEVISESFLEHMAGYCSEFLIHAVDVEGKSQGIETDLLSLLGTWDGIPVTYAGGICSFEDLKKIKDLGKGRIDITIGSALSVFGGPMDYKKIVETCNGTGS